MRGLWIVLHGLAVAVGFLATSSVACAQTLSPVIVEYRENARGSFRLRNEQMVPLDVVVEPHSFSVDSEGRPTFRPLDPQIHLRMSKMSFRLAPQQTYTVFYEAAAEELPVWFTIYTTITAQGPPGRLKVALQLPHTVYLLSRRPLDRQAVVFLRASTAPSGRTLEVVVENRSPEFARVQEVEVRSETAKRTYPGFPFFPGSQRVLRLDWDGRGEPHLVVLKFERFRVEWPLGAAGGKSEQVHPVAQTGQRQ